MADFKEVHETCSKISERRRLCQEEMEQDHRVRDPEQEGVWEEEEDAVEWAAIVRAQVPEEFVYVLIATYPYRIKWVPHAMT